MIAVLKRLTLQLALRTAFRRSSAHSCRADRSCAFCQPRHSVPPNGRRGACARRRRLGLTHRIRKEADYEHFLLPPRRCSWPCLLALSSSFRGCVAKGGVASNYPKRGHFITPMLLPRAELFECVAMGLFVRA